MAGETWSQEEVALIVADYRHMLLQELSGQPYNKAEHNRYLQQKTERSHGSIERKHQNISAVLRDASCYYIPGYKPLGNYQNLLSMEVSQQILSDPDFDHAVLHMVEKPWLPPINVKFRGFIVDPPQNSHVRDTESFYGHRPVKRDYLAREALNQSLGAAGEKIILDYERHRLRQLGETHLADQVEHVSKTQGDGLGYDILSFEPDGQERFIEVKTTGFGKALPFYMSRRELDFSHERSTQYHLYRVFGLQKTPQMFMVRGDMKQKLWLDPVNYQAGVLAAG